MEEIVPPKRRFTQDPHVATSLKMAFFNETLGSPLDQRNGHNLLKNTLIQGVSDVCATDKKPIITFKRILTFKHYVIYEMRRSLKRSVIHSDVAR
jgi:hypothetical protein